MCISNVSTHNKKTCNVKRSPINIHIHQNCFLLLQGFVIVFGIVARLGWVGLKWVVVGTVLDWTETVEDNTMLLEVRIL